MRRSRDFIGGNPSRPRAWGGWTVENPVADWAYKTHTRTKIIKLPNGEHWRPVADYVCGYITIRRNSGTTIRGDDNGGYILEIEGDSGVSPYFGPFVTTINSNKRIAPAAMPTNVKNRLATELMVKVGSRKASYGETLAESKKTVNHLAKTTVSLLTALQAARKGDWWAAAKALGIRIKEVKSGVAPASRWMEYQYGWMPLVNDIYDTTELLRKGFREKKHLMANVRVLRDTDHTDTMSAMEHKQRSFGNSTVSYVGKVYYQIDDSTLSRLAQMGLINPLEVAWAIAPFSFMVDWVLPLGPMLEALGARFGVTFVDGYFGTRVNGVYSTGYSRNGPLIRDEHRTRAEVFTYSRDKLTAFPVPGFYYKSPFSSTHLTTATAMTRQLRWK